eukprot:CAMPEP_0202687002 /NCGR_PEP_ID=MMETSP1385-20130828/2728_1 /ASSEMBLY_ACC=CAM_ASM_000861 /TAXON_ID=933848 /ORGANISM="Elphidium margaritaceum" /LENGTH=278 /DNA_ID=CAMNT_0049341705 /DNA_START=181 /DNA_END=1017 /DNA_ORIENTATION=-
MVCGESMNAMFASEPYTIALNIAYKGEITLYFYADATPDFEITSVKAYNAAQPELVFADRTLVGQMNHITLNPVAPNTDIFFTATGVGTGKIWTLATCRELTEAPTSMPTAPPSQAPTVSVTNIGDVMCGTGIVGHLDTKKLFMQTRMTTAGTMTLYINGIALESIKAYVPAYSMEQPIQTAMGQLYISIPNLPVGSEILFEITVRELGEFYAISTCSGNSGNAVAPSPQTVAPPTPPPVTVNVPSVPSIPAVPVPPVEMPTPRPTTWTPPIAPLPPM